MSRDDELARLKQRLERERTARRQAEVIAERGMRELWEANSELRNRVSSRTTELDRIIRSLDHRRQACLAMAERAVLGGSELAPDARDPLELVEAMLRSTTPEGVDGENATSCDPVEFADELMSRWQRAAAGSGLLLAVEIGAAPVGVEFDWSILQAIADTLLARCVEHSKPGALVLSVTTTSADASLALTDSGPGLAAETLQIGAATGWAAGVPGRADLVVAQLIATQAGGSLAVEADDNGTTVTAAIPASRVD